VKVDELVSSASACDIGLNPFISACKNTEYAQPNKILEYMMAGLAVVSSDLPELRTITRQLELGALFEARDPRQMAQAFNDRTTRRDWTAAAATPGRRRGSATIGNTNAGDS